MRRHIRNIIGLFAVLIVVVLQGDMVAAGKVWAVANQAGTQLSYSAASEEDSGQYNITLWVRDWENKTSFGNLNVTIFDLRERISSSYFSNGTGHINLLFLDAGLYVISVQDGNRTVGYEKINVIQNRRYLVKTWGYDLNMTLVDKQGEPLANHTVFLYDQMSFQTPSYTILPNTVERRENYTVITDDIGPLVRQAETDENGTLSLGAVWNGTYRLRILGKERWIERYVLGELVRILEEAAAGQEVIDHQGPANITLRCIRADLELHFVSRSNASLAEATVYIRSPQGHLLFEDQTNETGFVEHKNVYVFSEPYTVTARYGNRTVGYKVIRVTQAKVFTVECWTNNLTVRCVDWDGRPLTEHVVLLHDQVVFYSPTNVTVITNQTGSLVNWTLTDERGTVSFNDLWNGTYWVSVVGGEIIKEDIVGLQRSATVSMVCDKSYMALRFVTLSGRPLPEALVLVYDEDGNLVFKQHTDTDGYVRREGLRIGRYTVNVVWVGTQVWSGTVHIYQDRGMTIECMVYSFSLRCLDPLGNILPGTDVKLEKQGSQWEQFILDLEADETGSVSLLLPHGAYKISCSYGIYTGSQTVNLNGDYATAITCNVKDVLWLSIAVVALPLVSFTVLLERRKLRTPLEIRKHKTMLSKLEAMYKNGLVDYKIYRKLREEYEARIMELGGREMR